MRRWQVLLASLLVIGLVVGQPAGTARSAEPPLLKGCFRETGRCLEGRFYRYWLDHGGLANNGFPLSDPFIEELEDGKPYLVQYLERVRLEYHPENSPPYEILLGHFGRRLHRPDPPAASLAGATYFRETGHNLGGAFRDYWNRNGGLSQFGYPISEELNERLDDGQNHVVQYFERARFEKHPQNAPPYDILLGQFGRRILEQVPAATRTAQGRILFLDRDGVTLRTMRPDGSERRNYFTIRKNADEEVVFLTANPAGTQALYGLTRPDDQVTWYYLITNGVARRLAAFAHHPRWSPDGTRLIGQLYSRANGGITIWSYDLTRNTERMFEQTGQEPDWFPGARRIVYTDSQNLFAVDVAGGSVQQLTRLPTEGESAWTARNPHLLPSGDRIIFFGGQTRDLGASGNGQRWWSIPVGGGTPQPWDDPGGNAVTHVAFSPTGATWADSSYFHNSACASGASLSVVGANAPGNPLAFPGQVGLLDLDSEGLHIYNGLSWAPTGGRLVFATTPYSCRDFERTVGRPSLYLWDPTGGLPATRKIADGSYPVWVR